jgi:pseudaminic acid cytidylyltransferase
MPAPDDAGPTVAIVPARGGSKRIPKKNIRPFRGTPLLERTIRMLGKAGVFDRIIVSTDDEEIASLAIDAGAEVPFRRPAALADDHAGARPVIIHAIEALELDAGLDLGPVCIVYPAAVFIGPADIRDALAALEGSDADFVFAAALYDAPVQRALRRRADGTCEPMWSEHTLVRSQDLEPAYHDTGQFYWGRREAWLTGRPVFESNALMYELPRWRVQDIDTPDDWARAELIHRLIGDE